MEVTLKNLSNNHFARVSTATQTKYERTNAVATIAALGVTSSEPSPRDIAMKPTNVINEKKSPTVIAKVLEANENPKARPAVTPFFR